MLDHRQRLNQVKVVVICFSEVLDDVVATLTPQICHVLTNDGSTLRKQHDEEKHDLAAEEGVPHLFVHALAVEPAESVDD